MVFRISRLRSVLSWIWEARHGLLAGLVLFAGVLVPMMLAPTEEGIRLAGLCLQLLGILTVAWGIRETRKLFGHPSLPSKALSWLAKIPLGSRTSVGTLHATLPAATGSSRASFTPPPTVRPAIDTRLEAIENSIVSLQARIDAIDKESRQVLDALEDEQHARARQDAEIAKRLEATGTGGVHISAIGALWLFVGVTFSTAAPEIAELMNSLLARLASAA